MILEHAGLTTAVNTSIIPPTNIERRCERNLRNPGAFHSAGHHRLGQTNAWYWPIPHADGHVARRGFFNIVRNRVLSQMN